MSSSRKAIILIVEGINDEIVLEPINKLISNHKFRIKVVNGDPYTEKWHQSKTAKEIVGEIMKAVKKETKFKNSDIAHVIQLIDTDGAFIEDDHFIVDETLKPDDGKTYSYDLASRKVKVTSDSAKKALLRKWNKKSSHVRALKGGINYSSSKIPFKLYFNTLNMDHVIADCILTQDEKALAALKFIESMGDDLTKYTDFFRRKSPYVSYEDSWVKVIEDEEWDCSKSNIEFLIDKVLELESVDNAL